MRKPKVQFLINSVDLPFTCISYFFNVGMKDDSIRGISHLTEHIIIEELIKKESDLFQKNLINADVDKEFTCFHATVMNEDINETLIAFCHLFDCMDNELSKEIVESQKEIIFKIENERTLSNSQLINILLLEQLAFDGKVKKSTIVDETFLSLDERAIREFCKQTYSSSLKYLIISGDVTINNEKKFYNEYKPIPIEKTHKLADEDEETIFVPIHKFEDLNDVRKTVAIVINSIESVDKYYALHIICLFYKIFINNALKNTEYFINDITFKLYSERPIIFFNYNKYYGGTISLLRDFEMENCNELFENIKKHFIYGYLQKSCDLLNFNKEIYKVAHFFGKTLNFKNMVGLIKNVSFNDVILMHQKILIGEYIFVSEGICNEHI